VGGCGTWVFWRHFKVVLIENIPLWFSSHNKTVYNTKNTTVHNYW
jgi:hypothetical protein